MAAVAGRASAGWWAGRFELARGGEASNLAAMEGLRGVAVILVFFVHFATLSQPWTPPGGAVAAVLEGLHRVGHAGVDLFFVLSGYLIYAHLISKPRPFRHYIGRRVGRIYPTFAVVFAIYLLLSCAGLQHPSKIPDGGWEAAAYIVANLLLLPGIVPIEPLIAVAWSLSYEMFFYLSMPMLMVAFALRDRAPQARVAVFVLLTGAGLVLAAIFGGPVRLAMFGAGVLLREALVLRPTSKPADAHAAAAAAMAAATVVMLLPMPGAGLQAVRVAVLCGSGLMLCHACFSSRTSALSRALCWTPLRWLGNMSYSYYLVHGLALHAFFLVLATLLQGPVRSDLVLALLVPAFVATLVAGALLFLTVERPLSLTEAPLRRRKTPSASTVSP